MNINQIYYMQDGPHGDTPTCTMMYLIIYCKTLKQFHCNHNNSNKIIIVEYYVLDFTRFLTVVRVAGQNPLYT